MANGQDDKLDRGNINISLPFSQTALMQSLLGGQPQQPQGQAPLIAQNQTLTPNIAEPQAQQPRVAPSANLPEPPPAQAAPAPEPPIAQAAPQSQADILDSILNDPNRQQIAAQLNEKFGQQQQQRQRTIESLRENLEAQKQKGPDKVAALTKSLANFSDAFFGSDISKNVASPETAVERDSRLNALQTAIAEQEGKLTRDQINALQAALQGGGNPVRLIQALGRDERFKKSFDKSFEFNFRQRRQALGKETVKLGLQGLNTTLNNLDSEIPGGIEGFDPSKTNLPGIGGAEAALPLGRLSDQGRRMRQLALSLGNQVLKLRSGAQINEQEATRILGELGIDQAIGEGGGVKLVFRGVRSDQDFVNGVRDAKDSLNSIEDTLKLSFGEDAYAEVAPAFKKNRSRKRRSSAGPKDEADLSKMSTEELRKFVGE